MGTAYSARQSSYTQGDTINADDSNDEFDAILAAFGTSGHSHDGTAGEGGAIAKLLSNTLTFGAATSGTDITITFDGESNDGVLAWMEDEDYFKFSDDILINSTEKIMFGDSTSFIHQSSDGVLTIDGEATIDLNASTAVLVSNDLKLNSDAAVLGFGADNDVTLTHVADTGLLLNSTMAIQFNDASQYINAPSATVLDINATDEVEVNATLMDVNANLDVSGTSTFASDVTFTGASYNVVWDISDNALEFADSARLVFGTGSDLTIYHDGSNSYITESGDETGSFYIKGTNLFLLDAAGEYKVGAVSGGAVTLYHDDSAARLATSSTGVNVTGDVVATDDLYLDSDAAVIHLGDDGDVTLTHVADTGLLLNSTRQLQFGDSGTYIHQSADGVLDLVSDTEIEINATTVDINGAVDVSGAYTGGGLMTTGGNIVIPDAGNIGSASDTDAMTISSGGVVTFSQTPVFSGDLTIGDDVYLDSDAAVIHLGDDGDVTLTHVADTGILLNSTRQLQFGDSGTYIHQSADGVLDLVSDTEIEINATTIDINGAVDVSGAYTGGGLMTTGGNIVIPNAGNIGSASDTDAIAISSGGVVTMNQIPVFSAGINVSGGTIAGTLATAAQGNVTSLGTLTSLTVDNIIIDGTTIGHTSDTDLLTLASGVLTVAGELDATTLDISGNADIDGTLEADAMTLNGTAITATATLDTGIGNNNVPKFTTNVADDDFLRVDGTAIEGRSAAEVLSDIAAAPSAGSSNIVTTGALNSGSITSGFGAIDNGSSAITTTGDISGGTVNATSDTSAGDNAAIGYTSTEGLILTGQGSSYDITIKNDADTTVAVVPTGTDDLRFLDNAKAEFGTDGDAGIYHNGSNFYIDNSTGNTLAYSDTFQFFSKTGSETFAQFNHNGAVNLYHDDNLRLATDTVGVSITGNLVPASADGGRLGQTDLEWADLYLADSSTIQFGNDQDIILTHVPDAGIRLSNNDKMLFGDDNNLEIFYDGSDSHIKDVGSGDLYISASDDLVLRTKAGAETALIANDDGSVDLYYNNDKKFETTPVGATVTGTLIATTDTDTSNTGSVTLDFGANQNFVLTFTGNVTLANPSTEQVGQAGVIVCIQDGTGSRTLSLGTDYETAGGSGITLSTAANAVDVIPYFVKASGSIQLGAPQLAFS